MKKKGRPKEDNHMNPPFIVLTRAVRGSLAQGCQTIVPNSLDLFKLPITRGADLSCVGIESVSAKPVMALCLA